MLDSRTHLFPSLDYAAAAFFFFIVRIYVADCTSRHLSSIFHTHKDKNDRKNCSTHTNERPARLLSSTVVVVVFVAFFSDIEQHWRLLLFASSSSTLLYCFSCANKNISWESDDDESDWNASSVNNFFRVIFHFYSNEKKFSLNFHPQNNIRTLLLVRSNGSTVDVQLNHVKIFCNPNQQQLKTKPTPSIESRENCYISRRDETIANAAVDVVRCWLLTAQTLRPRLAEFFRSLFFLGWKNCFFLSVSTCWRKSK